MEFLCRFLLLPLPPLPLPPPAAPTMVIATMGMCRNEFCILCHDIYSCLHCSASLVWSSVRGSKAGGMGMRLVASEVYCSYAVASDSSRLLM